MADYPFSPLFLCTAASGHEVDAERFALGRVAVPRVASGTLEATAKMYDQTACAQTALREAMKRLELKRQGHVTLCTLADLDVADSDEPDVRNRSFTTLVSSENMLTPLEASKLAPTNAPVMRSEVHRTMGRSRSV